MKKFIYAILLICAFFSCTKPTSDENRISVIQFDVTSIELVEGESIKLNLIVNSEIIEYTSSYYWGSAHPWIATLHDGILTAHSEGTTYVTATSMYQLDKKARCEVTVTKKPEPYRPVTDIFLNKRLLVLAEGDTFKLEADIYPHNSTNRDILWSSSEESVISVSDGLLTALSEGTSVITAHIENEEIAAECIVKVLDASGHDPISFVDKTAKMLCIRAYDINADGELSYVEACSVTDMSRMLDLVEPLTPTYDFPEFQHFNSISCIPDDGFKEANVWSLVLPESVTSIGDRAFEYGLNSIIMTDSVETIGEYAFHESRLNEITIPEGVKRIKRYAFLGSYFLHSVYVRAVNPPHLELTGTDYSAGFAYCAPELKIYVPAESVDLYKETSGWATYKDVIVGYDFETNTIIEE